MSTYYQLMWMFSGLEGQIRLQQGNQSETSELNANKFLLYECKAHMGSVDLMDGLMGHRSTLYH